MFRLAAVLLVSSFVTPLTAQPTEPAQGARDRLVAAVHSVPPYAIKNADGTWDGIAVELWREIGRAEGFEAALQEVRADDLLNAVARGDVDLALTSHATADDEARVDFVLPYVLATLGLAETRGTGVRDVLKRLVSPTFIKIVIGLVILLLLVGAVAWLVERSENEDDFRQGINGVWDGFYWAGVTMSTIGYGDKAPKTVGGRALALVWMLVSMGVTAALTAAIVSAVGLRGEASASLPSDVRGKDVGVVEGSVAASYLDAERVRFQPYPSTDAGLRAVKDDSLDVFVGAVPVLKHAVEEIGLNDLHVAATSAEPVLWAFAVPVGSGLRERLGRAVLDRTSDPAWQATLARYGS